MGGSNILGKRIEQIRKDRGETQQQLADAVGVKRETVNQWESGTRHLKAEAVVAIAKHYKVSSDYLLGLAREPTNTVEESEFLTSYGLKVKSACALRADFAPLDDEGNYEAGFTDDDVCTPNRFLNALLQHDDLFFIAVQFSNALNNFVASSDVITAKAGGDTLFINRERHYARLLLSEVKELMSATLTEIWEDMCKEEGLDPMRYVFVERGSGNGEHKEN